MQKNTKQQQNFRNKTKLCSRWIISVQLRLANAIKIWANAKKVWANAIKVWGNASKVWANASKISD